MRIQRSNPTQELALCEANGVAAREVVYASNEHMEKHAHDTLQVTVVLAGSLQEIVGAARVQARPWDVGVKPPGTEHANDFDGQHVHLVTLEVNADGLDFQGPALQWGWAPRPSVSRQLFGLAKSARALNVREIDDGAIEILGLLQGPDGSRRRTPPAWLKRVRERVLDTFRQGVATRELAVGEGLHPVYLARCFRQAYRESISDCVRRMRLCRAGELLARSTMPIAQIAVECGFTDQSHLNRLFLQATTFTPRKYRQLTLVD